MATAKTKTNAHTEIGGNGEDLVEALASALDVNELTCRLMTCRLRNSGYLTIGQSYKLSTAILEYLAEKIEGREIIISVHPKSTPVIRAGQAWRTRSGLRVNIVSVDTDLGDCFPVLGVVFGRSVGGRRMTFMIDGRSDNNQTESPLDLVEKIS